MRRIFQARARSPANLNLAAMASMSGRSLMSYSVHQGKNSEDSLRRRSAAQLLYAMQCT